MSFTPFILQDTAPEELQDQIVKVMLLDAELNAKIPRPLLVPMTNLLRVVNSYYSNKIEGNSTVPADILRAEQAQDAPREVKASKDFLEIKRHIEAQRRLTDDPIDPVAVCTRDTISRLHREFYVGAPEEMLDIQLNDKGDVVRMVPGVFREYGVRVGHHTPPTVEQMQGHLAQFERVYRLDWIHGLSKFLAAAASHHRLMWIHPFMDGNGRTGRLFTDQYLKAAGFGGYGLWSMSRGFARNTAAYYDMLNAADHPRKGDHEDGRGILSDSGLLRWTRYFTETALDQVQYFSTQLDPDQLSKRIDVYFEMRSRGALSDGKGNPLPELRIEARHVYKTLLYMGDQPRAELQASLGVGERTTRGLLSQMSKEGLITLDGRKPVSLNLSRHSIEFLFPYLW
ncbi:MAG: Fic family protein [Pseudomonas sp.]|uniref:Fic family protein n=1 Tax=Pseudomonas putida TaxID=303 RepID=UPI0005B985CD|nr:Fic family protein [Pseudomonas putida]